MNSSQLTNILYRNEQTSASFQGIYPIDQLPQVTNYPVYIIINTSKSHVYDGHWVLLYLKNTKETIFFDSYGRTPANVNNGHILHEYLSKYTLTCNYYVLQSVSSNVCGMYCLYVAFYLCRGMSFRKMFSKFYTDVDCNDTLLVKTVKRLFAVK
jgi:hypothetical protein